jgi:lipopolysaccharide export system protein LptA
MAASFHNLRCAVAITALLLVASAALGAEPSRRTLPISVDAASTEVDYRNNSILLRDVIIEQGDVRVQADEARANGGLNFADSQWTFSGNVRIRAEGGSLNSNQAVVSFTNNLISRAVITGKPAQFEQARPGTTQMAKGRAETIEYETATGAVSLLTDAWLSDGRNEIRGERVVYSIREQRVQARQVPGTTGDAGRVRIIIQPGTTNEPAAKPAQEPQP